MISPYVTSTHLSDGRELIYFDQNPIDRLTNDTRDLDSADTISHVRQDALTNEWVIIAAARQSRVFMPTDSECPLCPSQFGYLSEIPDTTYDVVVFENRFPSLSQYIPIEKTEEPAGYGRCEVVCFSSDHTTPLGMLSTERIELYIAALKHRCEHLAQDAEIKYIFAFENRGTKVGVTLSHPHGQIYAYPFVPPRIKTMVQVEKTMGANPAVEIRQRESKPSTRLLLETEYWIAFVPYAARWPYEVHIFPKRDVGLINELNDAETAELAKIYGSVLSGFESLFESETAYIASWIQSPVNIADTLSCLHIEIASPQRAEYKLKFLAGSESGMGAFINDIEPEAAAETLRPLVTNAWKRFGADHGR